MLQYIKAFESDEFHPCNGGSEGGGGRGGTCAESEAGCAAEGEELLAGNNAGDGAPQPSSGFIDSPWMPRPA